MRRRRFIAAMGGALASPFTVRAQPVPMPVVGLLSQSPSSAPSGPVEAIILALKQAGLEVNQAIRMEYRYANNQYDRLPVLAAELVNIPAAVIITTGGLIPTVAAKAATTTIPIVFAPVSDPVAGGLVSSLNRPGGNITGIAAFTVELDPKRLELLHELSPPGVIGVLLNPNRPDSQSQVDSIRAAARSVGRDVVLEYAGAVPAMEAAFSTFKERSIAGLLVGADGFFSSQRAHVVAQAARYGWPAIYQWREFAEAGGFASYGPNLFDGYRQTGFYAARILKGEKPADLPVQQPTKFEFVINLRTAKALGRSVPLPMLSRADEVIE